MYVLVTGAFGFVGREVVKVLLKEGHDVLATDIVGANSDPEHYLDVTDQCAVFYLMEACKPDVVVHLAARVAGPPSLHHPYTYYYTNIIGTLNILESMRELGIKNLVFVSSWSVYGSQIDLPIDEFTPANPETPYGVSKLICEQLIENYSDVYGIRAVVLRPTHIYGPNQTEKNAVQQVVDCMASGDCFKIYGDGKHLKEWLYVTDMARVVASAVRYVTGMNCEYDMFIVGGKLASINWLVKQAQKISPFSIKYVKSNKLNFSQKSDITRTNRMLNWFPLVTLYRGLKTIYDERVKNG